MVFCGFFNAFSYFCYRKPDKNGMKRFTFIVFLLSLFGCTLLSATHRVWHHYTVGDGLITNEVRQVVELPNGQVLVNCEGAFCLFDGQTFREVPCDLSRAYRLEHFGGYARLWEGDSLLWLRDYYHLYLFDARTRTFRYDAESRLGEEPVKQLIAKEGSEESTEEKWQLLIDSLGARANVAHAMDRHPWQRPVLCPSSTSAGHIYRAQRQPALDSTLYA